MADFVDPFVSGSRLPGPGDLGLIPCEVALPKAAQKESTSGWINS
jgi:hypothetical protein